MIPSEHHESCKKCKLFATCRTPFMESSGSDEPDILVIGEAPGEAEDERGIPFVGRSGHLLRDALQEMVDISTVRFTNVVRCRPPENKITKKAITNCAQFAIAEIEKYNPPIVILLGNSPLNGILGQSGISSWNGVMIEKDERVYLPLYHPAYILRNPGALDEWLAGMLKLSEESDRKARFARIFPKTLDELKEMHKYLEGCEFISFDVETNMLDAYGEGAKIISISFAGGEYSYSFPIDHRESWWDRTIPKGKKPKLSEYEQVIGIVYDILYKHSGKLIGHNIKFDQMHAQARWDLDTEAGGDSMLLSHMLDSRQGIHGLKRLAGVHLGMYEYEQELTNYINAHPEANPKKGGSYDFIPLNILLPYGAMDAEATLMLHDKLYDQLSEKQQTFYDQVILPASDTLRRIQCNGIMLDEYIAKRYTHLYRVKRDEVYEKIQNDPKVKRLTNKHQAELDSNDNGKKVKKRKIFKFNPGSFIQLQELYYKYYKIPVVGYTDTGSPTTKSSTLRPMEDDYPILHHIRYYKLLSKMLSTYLVPASEGNWKSADGRVRTSYNMHGTKTGRLSSGGTEKKINLQNIPTPEKEPNTLLQVLPIKNVFTHSYLNRSMLVRCPAEFQKKFGGGVVLSVDYSGMELRVFASLANCEPMLAIHRSGRDFHSTVAIIAQTGKHIDEVTDDDIAGLEKAVRYRYKWTNWTLLYGGGKGTLMHLYGMSEEEAEAVISEYYSAFPEVLDYRNACEAFAEENGYIESPYGRRERLFYIGDPRATQKQHNRDIRSAVNMPVQSAASDTLLIAAVIIDDKLRSGGFQSKLSNTVHDSLMLDVPRDEILQVSYICKDVMENVVTYAKDYMPDVDMSWLKSPLKADVELGTHYGSLIDLEEWVELNHVAV